MASAPRRCSWIPISAASAKTPFESAASSPKQKGASRPVLYCLAEREGFEPSISLLSLYSLSRGAPSTTRPPLRSPLPKPSQFYLLASPSAAEHLTSRQLPVASLQSRPDPSWRLASGDSRRVRPVARG